MFRLMSNKTSRGSWKECTHKHRCAICEKPDWCSYSEDGAVAVCRRVDGGNGIHRTDVNGADYWLYVLKKDVPFDPTKLPPPAPKAERADKDTLDHVYREMLADLPLNQCHIDELAKRGLSREAMERHGFKSMQGTGRAAIVRKLEAQFGADTLLNTPGFYIKNEGSESWISIAGKDGLYIPVRDLLGRIQAVQIEPDEPGESAKYIFLSSAGHDGPGPGAPVHFPVADSFKEGSVRLTSKP